MAADLELVAHGITAILATWLGLTVLTRARPQSGSILFAAIAASLVAWSVAIVIQRLTTLGSVLDPPFRAVEDATAYLLLPFVLHLVLVLVVEARRSTAQRVALIVAYGLCGAAALGAILFPEQRLAVNPPHLELPGVSGATLGWAWIGVRVGILAAAVFWIARALRVAGGDVARGRLLRITLATVSVAAFAAILRFLPSTAASVPWLSVVILALALLLAAYGVFAQGVFLTPQAAAYAFRYTMVIGLGVSLLVVALLAVDRISQATLGIDLPIVTALALVASIALFDPITSWARRTIRGRSAAETAYDRLLRALGQDVLTAQKPQAVVVPALARLTRTFRLLGAQVETASGEIVARHGKPVAGSPLAYRLALRTAQDAAGSVTFGPKRSLLPFTPDELELLGQGAAYLAASLRLAHLTDEQAQALELLNAETESVEARATDLSAALIEAAHGESGLRVFALGPLRVERNGTALRHWGGAKAGTRHAEALFAFLFDRGERGVGKDEATELIWPDIELQRADLAFHRTLGGLRSTLEPERRGADRGDAITFHNDRYRLSPSLVTWSDVGAFDEAMAASARAGPEDVLGHLERARALYRGDYLDDCPFYGDSAQAEERREVLKGRYIDLLLAIGERYELRGDRPSAAASFREARTVAGEDLPRADAALARLAAPV